MAKDNKEYYLYKGKKILSVGTIEEIANDLCVKECTIAYYKTDAHKRKVEKKKSTNSRSLVLVEDDN